ncbi:DNA-processing protein DprA [Flavobacterium silvaticum]|uniref:DNA-protecting protein DprA n=1 Tax=Flavobacterium silvaticum TaxID=1852020 RepID=A0A972JIK3_9FLAO|nr:DNA-processing protein DprA [Flavobacterium silvaticum]NMH28348.1 DNA-protecting protein DprA [Flavobacterium silvaticum]
MRHTDLIYLIALRQCYGIGDITAKKLLTHFKSAEEVFKRNPVEIAGLTGIGLKNSQNIKLSEWLQKAEREAEFAFQNNIDCQRFDDPDYPEKLKHCPDGPTLLFSKGNINLKDRKIISIVGTRKVTAAGIDFCRRLIFDLAPLDPVIVSGFAYGVDIVAHQAAIEKGLQTIAVMAHGHNQIYPKPHQKFVKPILENGGFMTEFCTWENPLPENFVKRNRIVAGLSEATVVIESAEKGGSLITANMALDYNRDVFAVPGKPTDPLSQGCNNLIKTQRAQILTQAADLVYSLNWDLKKTELQVQKQLFVDLSDEEKLIFDHLSQTGNQSLDVIALECGFPVQKLSGLLLQMELKGVVRPMPGKMFQAV